MKRVISFLTAMTVMVFCAAGIASADSVISTFTKITPDISSSTVTGVGTNDVTYAGGGWSSGLSPKWWDPVLGSDNDYSPITGDKYGFAGGSFTMSEDASVTMKVTAFSEGALSGTEIYLYQGAFDRLNPNTNKIGSWDGLAGVTQTLLKDYTYTFVVTSDDPFIPASGAATVTADITAAPVTPVPIPAAAWLFGSGLLGLVGIRKRSKK